LAAWTRLGGAYGAPLPGFQRAASRRSRGQGKKSRGRGEGRREEGREEMERIEKGVEGKGA